MKPMRRVIHIVKHIPTGAEVPVEIKKVENNVITDYKEVIKGRKAFSIKMLEKRWNKQKDEVINLLQHYQVPAHVHHPDVKTLKEDEQVVDVAVFFEEYILALEKKEKLSHTKLKPRSIGRK